MNQLEETVRSAIAEQQSLKAQIAAVKDIETASEAIQRWATHSEIIKVWIWTHMPEETQALMIKARENMEAIAQ